MSKLKNSSKQNKICFLSPKLIYRNKMMEISFINYFPFFKKENIYDMGALIITYQLGVREILEGLTGPFTVISILLHGPKIKTKKKQEEKLQNKHEISKKNFRILTDFQYFHWIKFSNICIDLFVCLMAYQTSWVILCQIHPSWTVVVLFNP